MEVDKAMSGNSLKLEVAWEIMEYECMGVLRLSVSVR